MYFYCLYFCNQEKRYSGNKIVTFAGALLTAVPITVTIVGLPVPPRLPHSLLSTWSPYLLEAEVPWPVTLSFLQSCRLVSVPQLCPTLCDPMDCSPPGSVCPWNSPGKNTGVGCHFHFQGIFPTRVSCMMGRFFTV